MSNIQAAIGCAQIERIDSLVQRKREIFSTYRKKLAALPGVAMNPEPLGTINGAWMPTIVFSPETGITREKLQAAFVEENVDARVFFWPLSSLDMFQANKQNVNSWSIPQRAINLPSYHDLTEANISRVTDVLKKLSSAC